MYPDSSQNNRTGAGPDSNGWGVFWTAYEDEISALRESQQDPE